MYIGLMELQIHISCILLVARRQVSLNNSRRWMPPILRRDRAVSLGSAELHRLHVPVVHLRRQHAGPLQQLELLGAVVEAEVVQGVVHNCG